MALTKIPGSLIDTSSGINGLIYPSSDGTAGQFLTTDGSGNLSFATTYTDSDVETYLDGGTSTPTFATATVSGTLTVTGDLDITGNINSYNVTDLDVTDQTITLGAGQTEANSGGSGIIIDGSGASILWDETNTEFDINTNLKVSTNTNLSFASDTVNSITLGTSGTNKPCIKFDTADTTHTNRVWAIENGAGNRLNFFRNGLDVLKLNQDGSVEIPGSIINSSAGVTVATFEGNYSANGDVKLASFERIGGAVAAAITYADATTDMEFGTTTSHALSFITGDTRRVTIDTSGRLLAGTTSVGARSAHTLARTGSFAAEILQQQTSAGASVLGLTYDGAAPNNTTDYFIYAIDTVGIKHLVRANGDGYFAGNVGIGETNPDASLHITSNTPIISFDESDASQEYRIGSFGGTFALYDSTDSAYRIAVDGSGNVGIGETSPDNILHIKTTAAGGPQIHMDDGTNSAFINFDGTSLQLSTQRDMVDGTWHNTSKSWGGINILGPATGSYITFATANSNNTPPSERMRIQANGGISFNGDTAAANALDDYEEGTFSPTLANAYNITSLTLSEAGRYVKIGNLVHFEFQVSGDFTNAAVESRFSFTVPFNLATSSSRATGMFSHHLTSFSNGRFNNGQIFQGTTTDTASWVYISTNQLSGIGSFTGRATFTYVAA